MALQPPDDLIELPPEVMALPPEPPPIGFGPPADLIDPPTVPYGGGLAPDQNPTLNTQQKNFLNTTAVGRVMDAFGQGFSETFAGDWGIQPKDMQRLREEGLFFRPEQEMSDPIGLTFQAFAESVIAPAAKAGDFALRLGLSPLVATARALGQASQETGLAATLGYRPSESGRGVSDDIIGAVDTLGLMFGMHVPTAPGALVTRRERIAGRERLMPNQVPTPGPHKPVQPPEVMPPGFSEPDVVPRPPGAVAAAEVPTTVAARVEAPGPSVQIGEQRVVFPDENHAALFEYGEAIAHGERPAVAGELATEFGQQGAANIDAVAQAYYDRVATKIESTAGEIAAGRVDEPGPATFRTTPAGIAQEHALEVAQLEREAAELAVAPRAQPFKQPYDMTLPELDQAISLAGLSEHEKLVRAVGGEERAALFNRLDRRMNSADTKKADEAAAEFDRTFGVLTPEQERLIYGHVDDPDMSAEQLREIRKAREWEQELPDMSDTEVARVMTRGMLDTSPDKARTFFEGGRVDAFDQAAILRIEIGMKELAARGLSRQQIDAAMASAMEGRGFSRDNAMEVLSSWRRAQSGEPEAPLIERPVGYGDANALVKTSEADEARALLNSSVQRLTSGIDPEQVLAGVKLAIYHIEAGARSFAAYSKAIIADLGEWAKPYIRDWYDKASRAIAEFAADEFGGAPPRLPRSQRMRPPPPEMHSNRAGNINLDRINAPDDVMNVIREIADQNAGFPDVRRGRMTFEDIRNLADAAGMDARVLAKRGAGTAFNAEEAVRLRDLLVTSATHVQELSRKAIGASDEDLLKFQQALTRHAAIQEQVAGVTAEAGRALASFNIKAAEVERAKALTDLMDRFGGRATLEEKAAAIRNLNDPEAISRTIRKLEKATTMDMIVEAWMNGLLSGPLTHATNMVSNTLTNLANIAELGVAAGIGAAREAVGIGGRERIFAGEVGERVFSMVQGAQEGVIAARQAFADDAAASIATGKLDVRRPGAIPSVTVDIPGLGPTQVGGATVRIPSRLLSAEDAFFQTLAKRQETSALAYRKAMQEGLSGEKFAQRVAQLTADPTKEMLDEIGKSQTYLTFTKPLGPQGRKIQSAINHYPAMRFLVPFLRTPTNIIKYAGERTVLSSFSKEVRANLSGRNGQVAQDTQLARLVIGTAVTVSALYWASSGMITGGGPSDPRARALLYATGWQPYSVKIGDTYYSYLRPLGPFGILLGVSADAAEISDRADQTDLSEIGKLAFASATTNLLNQTWLQGPSDLAQALNDPERYGESYVQSLTSSLVPSFLAQEARNQDPYLREARGIIDGWKSRIPGLSTSLLPRRDIWGEPIRREGGLGPDRLSPIYLTAIKSDFISREMLRLGVWKSQPARSIRGVELTDEQYGRFQQTSGRLTRQALSTVVGRPGWDQIPAYAQANLINRLFDRARESARSQMMISDPGLLSKIIQTGVAEVVSEPESAGLIKYPPMPAVPTGAQ